jgi:WD40 repeat protein/serine/threonine protein kinase
MSGRDEEDRTLTLDGGGTLTLLDGTFGAEEVAAAAGNAPAEWAEGDMILGLYKVLEVLGTGAFGTVHRVYHKGWNQDMAVKSLHPNLSVSERHRQAFVEEAENWVGLGLHPNVASCFYVRNIGGLPRIFSEYLAGGTLEGRAVPGTVEELASLLDLALQCLDGLAFAHDKGLIHRDVKPANCLLAASGELKVADFGIASSLATEIPQGTELAFVPTKTQCLPGGAVGTPGYMPPEQWEPSQGEAGPWSDIYAFGAMLFQLCSGGRPFDGGGETLEVLRLRHLGMEAPLLSAVRPGFPASLDAFVATCLAKDPARRFQTCRQARLSLAEVFRVVTGQPYPRKEGNEIDRVADGANNRAVSLMDLGRQEEALAAWSEALEADPLHLEATFNRGLVRWRSGQGDDQALLEALDGIGRQLSDPSNCHLLTAQVHLERRDFVGAVAALAEAGSSPEALALRERSRQVPARPTALSRTLIFEKVKQTTRLQSCAVTTSGHRAISSDQAIGKGIVDDPRYADKERVNSLRIWDLHRGVLIKTIEDYEFFSATRLEVNEDGSQVVAASLSSGELRHYDLTTGKVLWSLPAESFTTIFDIAWQVAAGRVAVAGKAFRRDRNREKSNPLRGPQREIFHVLEIWDLASRRCLHSFDGPRAKMGSDSGGYKQVAISPDGAWLVAINRKGEIQFWDLKKGLCVRTLKAGFMLALAGDFREAMTVSSGVLRLLDLATGKCKKELCGHGDGVTALHLSVDGRWAISGGLGGDLKVWDVDRGVCLRTLQGHEGAVASVWLSPDLSRIVSSGASDLSVRVWDLSLGNFRPQLGLRLSRVKDTRELEQTQEEFTALLTRGKQALVARRWNDGLSLLRQARELPGFERSVEGFDAWKTLYGLVNRVGFRGGWCERVLEGHAGDVRSVAISPGGETLLSGSSDRTARLWCLGDGSCLHTISEHKQIVPAVAFAPEGSFFATAPAHSPRDSVRIWSLPDGAARQQLAVAAGGYSAVTISQEGQWLLAAGGSDLFLFRTTTGKLVRRLVCHRGGVTALVLSPCGRWVLSASHDGTLGLWDLWEGELIRRLSGPQHGLMDVAWSPDGRWAVSGGQDERVHLWDVLSGRCVRELEGHKGSVQAVSLLADGRWAASGGDDGTVRIWDLITGAEVHVFEGHEKKVMSVAFAADGSLLASGGEDGGIRCWALDWELGIPGKNEFGERLVPHLEAQLLRLFPLSDDPTLGVPPGLCRGDEPSWDEAILRSLFKELGHAGFGSIPPDQVVTWLKKRTARWSSGQTKAHGRNRFVPQGVLEGLASTDQALADRNALAAGKALDVVRQMPGFSEAPMVLERWLRLYDYGCRSRFVKIHPRLVLTPNQPASRIVLCPCGERAATVGRHGIAVWNLPSGELLSQFGQGPVAYCSLSFGPGGRTLLSGGTDGVLVGWDAQKGTSLWRLKGHQKRAVATWSRDGRWILSGSQDWTVRLWDAETGGCIQVFEDHRTSVNAVWLSPDGRWGLSAAGSTSPPSKSDLGQHTMRLWDLAAGRCVQIFRGHESGVTCCVMSPDGSRVVSGSADKTVRVWDRFSGECLYCFNEHRYPLNAVTITMDGRHVLSVATGPGSRAFLWPLTGGKGQHFPCGTSLCVSQDGRLLARTSNQGTSLAWIEWELDLPPTAPWDDRAWPYLKTFVECHRPISEPGPGRKGLPVFGKEALDELWRDLGAAGFGWLDRVGVQERLDGLACGTIVIPGRYQDPAPSKAFSKASLGGILSWLFGNE